MVKGVSVGPTVSAFWRMFYAALLIYLVYALESKGKLSNGWKNSAWVGPAFAAGVFLAIDMVIWHKTIIYIGAGPATFLGNSQILFVTLFGAFVFKEKIGWLFPIIMPIVLYGLYLLIPSFNINVVRSSAYVMGLAVGATYGGYLICLRYAKGACKENYPEVLSLSFIMMVTSLGIAVWGVGVERVDLFCGNIYDHITMLIIALISNTLGWILIKANITKIPAHQGSLLLLMQPVLTTTWAGLFFAEAITLVQLIGGVLVIGGIALYQLYMESAKSEIHNLSKEKLASKNENK
jgi:drug/metabolite transporter (DMT)-like permease